MPLSLSTKKLLLGALALLLLVLWLAARWLPPPPLVIRRPATVPVVRKPVRRATAKHVSLVKHSMSR